MNMKKFLLLFAMAFCAGTGVVAQQKTVKETVFDRAAHEQFAFGADISWLSQQESWNTYYCNRKGQRTDLMTILKSDFGLNAVRFRVWVNPSGGWSGKQDVINLCKRAHAKGLKIMISFHYSDTWADSGSQTIPAQWTDHSADALAQKVYEHTYDVLKGLKDEGIIPVWVSIGNETKYGMLYETGRTKTTEGVKNIVKFINSGYQAVQDIDPSIISIIHLPNAHDEGTARNMFDNLKKYGAHYDAIGLSAYPRWSHLDITTDAGITAAINKYMTTFKNLKARFGKPVVVMETGHYVDKPLDANRFLAEFMKALIQDGELGCFYWEPEASSGYNLGAWDGVTHQATIAMDAYMGVKHTAVNRFVNTTINQPDDTRIYKPGEEVELKIYAKTPTKVTSVAKVDLFLNGARVASVEPTPGSNFFSFRTNTLAPKAYRFTAKAYDDQGNMEKSDTVCFLVSDVTTFQEQGDGFVACSEADEAPAKHIKRYTGQGYIETSDDKTKAITWQAHFPTAGQYTFFFRYHTDKARLNKLFVDEASTSVTFSLSPSGRWTYATKKVTIDAEGDHLITLQGGSTHGIPDLDLMAIASPEGAEKVSYVKDETSRVHAPTEDDQHEPSSALYDLAGRRLKDGTNMKVLPRGVYLHKGRKFLVR